jgi:hypothetical protein
VRNRHELSQGRTTEQRMVWTVEVHHLELDRLTAVVVFFSEQHLQLDSSHWRAGVSRHDAVKG